MPERPCHSLLATTGLTSFKYPQFCRILCLMSFLTETGKRGSPGEFELDESKGYPGVRWIRRMHVVVHAVIKMRSTGDAGLAKSCWKRGSAVPSPQARCLPCNACSSTSPAFHRSTAYRDQVERTSPICGTISEPPTTLDVPCCVFTIPCTCVLRPHSLSL